MKVLLAGAFGNLGFEILKVLVERGYDVVAADLKEKEDNGLEGKYTFKAINATDPETLKGICDGVEVVITTMGLTSASTVVTAYDVDYQGNLNLYNEAVAAKVPHFTYISVIACKEPGAEEVPLLHAKAMFEDEVLKGPIPYVIHRPTGYFYDIAKVFKPYIEKGEMQLLKGYHNVQCNVVDCPDFANYIVDHMLDENAMYEVGGKETYDYEEITKMCFRAAGKPVIIKDAAPWMFSLLGKLPKIKKEGKADIMKFGAWTMTHSLVGKDVTGDASFKEYITNYFGGDN